MKKKTSSQKGTTQQAVSKVCRQQKSVENQQDEKMFSKEELIEINGIVKGKTEYFSMYLSLFLKKEIIYDHPRTTQRLAQFLYNKKELYVHREKGYKRMEFSSILTELNTLKKAIQEKIEEEENNVKKEENDRNSHY